MFYVNEKTGQIEEQPDEVTTSNFTNTPGSSFAFNPKTNQIEQQDQQDISSPQQSQAPNRSVVMDPVVSAIAGVTDLAEQFARS